MQIVKESLYFRIPDLLNGSKSPIIPSPPPPSANSVFDHSNFLTPFAGSDKQQNIEFGTVGQKLSTMNNNPFVTALINNAAAMEKNRMSRKYSVIFLKWLNGRMLDSKQRGRGWFEPH